MKHATVSRPDHDIADIAISVATEVDQVVRPLTLAFAADPVLRWMFPQTSDYLAHFPALVKLFADRAVECGTAFVTRNGTGGAVWLPPGAEVADSEVERFVGESFSSDREEEIAALFAQLDEHHPHEAHWYLALVGVDPAHHGKGIGSHLLQRVLMRCEQEQLPAYLEATATRNIALYRKHGFTPTGVVRNEQSTLLVPMLRQPGRYCS